MLKRSLVLMTAIVLAACARESTQPASQTQEPQPQSTAAAPATEGVGPMTIRDGLQTPESVLYDAAQDVYFISNINGQPLAKDANGYISKVNPDTLGIEAKWIDGSKKGSQLDAPKGMAIVGDELWVTDITDVKKFDRKSGAPKGTVAIPGSTFLNDLTSDGTSGYVSDSGMKAGANGNFEGTGTDSVWKITGTKATKIASGKDLNRPNGLEMAGGKLWVVSFASNELYSIDKGAKANVATLPKGSLDGLVHLSDDTFLVSSWESNSVFRGPASGPFAEVITGVTSPADIGYDTKRHRVLVPHFTESIVTIHDLQ